MNHAPTFQVQKVSRRGGLYARPHQSGRYKSLNLGSERFKLCGAGFPACHAELAKRQAGKSALQVETPQIKAP